MSLSFEIGQRFGKLVVVDGILTRRDRKTGHDYVVLVRCDCGTIKDVISYWCKKIVQHAKVII